MKSKRYILNIPLAVTWAACSCYADYDHIDFDIITPTTLFITLLILCSQGDITSIPELADYVKVFKWVEGLKNKALT